MLAVYRNNEKILWLMKIRVNIFNNKSILIAGGIGSFGKQYIKTLL